MNLLKSTNYSIILILLFIINLIFSNCVREKTASVYETEIILDGKLIFSSKEFNEGNIGLYENFDIFGTIDSLLISSRFNEASAIFQQVLNHLNHENDPCRRAHLLLNIQGLLIHQDKTDTYIDYVKNYIHELTQCNDDFTDVRINRMQVALSNIGLAYLHLDKPDSAYHYIDKAIILNEQHYNYPLSDDEIDKVLSLKGMFLGNKARAVYLLGRNTEAIDLWEKSIELNSIEGREVTHSHIMRLRLANLHINEENFDEAERLINEARVFFNETNDSYLEPILREYEWKFFDRSNRTEEAYKAHLIHSKLALEAMDKKIHALELNLQNEYRKLSDSYQKEILAAENRLKNIYIIFLGSLIFISLVIIYMSINSRRKLEIQANRLEQSNKLLDLNKQRIESIIKMVAHELKNSIFGIKQASILLQELPFNADTQHDLTGLIIKSADDMQQIAEVIMTDKADSIYLTPSKKFLNWSDIISSSIKGLKLRAKNKNQTIVIDCDSNHVGYFDPDLIQQVIHNLVDNAIKFSPKHSKITIYLEGDDLFDQLIIQDEGLGIDADDKINHSLSKVSELTRKPGTDDETSYGIGLKICKDIVDAHGGEISFNSEINKGTTFFVRFPKKTPHHQKNMARAIPQ